MPQVFIFQGHTDPIVPWENALLIHQFYSEFTEEEGIAEMSDLDTSHGFPTTNYGCASDLLCPPFYFSNCNYNGAVAVLQQMVSSVANGTVHDPPGFEDTLFTFDQEDFFDGDAEAMSMATGHWPLAGEGFFYVPPQCSVEMAA